MVRLVADNFDESELPARVLLHLAQLLMHPRGRLFQNFR
jgi:hypothetical protein